MDTEFLDYYEVEDFWVFFNTMVAWVMPLLGAFTASMV